MVSGDEQETRGHDAERAERAHEGLELGQNN
jgi:hypothetical protein